MVPQVGRGIPGGRAAVPFAPMLEFMIGMPLGPDCGGDLGISRTHLGIHGSADRPHEPVGARAWLARTHLGIHGSADPPAVPHAAHA